MGGEVGVERVIDARGAPLSCDPAVEGLAGGRKIATVMPAKSEAIGIRAGTTRCFWAEGRLQSLRQHRAKVAWQSASYQRRGPGADRSDEDVDTSYTGANCHSL